MDSNNFLSECWRLTRTEPAKRARSMCDIALGCDIDIMPMGSLAEPGMAPWNTPVPALPALAAPPSAVCSTSAASASAPQLKSRSSRPPPAVEDALSRSRAIATWADIIRRCGAAFGINKQLEGAAWTEADLEPYFLRSALGPSRFTPPRGGSSYATQK